MLDLNENIHYRQNPLIGDSILVSPYFFKTSWEGKPEITKTIIDSEYDSNCYPCPENKREGDKINSNYSQL